MTNFEDCFKKSPALLMEGAIGERLKREYHIQMDEYIVMGGLVYNIFARKALYEIWNQYASIASKYHLPFLATTPTRRVNQDRISHTIFDGSVIEKNVTFLRQIQKEVECEMYVGGMIGCYGDAYSGIGCLSEEESEKFHDWEISRFVASQVDFIYAALQPDLQEAAGIGRCISKYAVPYIISFTIRSDGCLIDGHTIHEAIAYIDSIVENKPVCYMANCVHPAIAYQALENKINRSLLVKERFLGLQANTSTLDYDQLDNSKDLKTSDPVELAKEMMRLNMLHPLKIFGGCCGTDERHMEEIAKRIKEL